MATLSKLTITVKKLGTNIKALKCHKLLKLSLKNKLWNLHRRFKIKKKNIVRCVLKRKYANTLKSKPLSAPKMINAFTDGICIVIILPLNSYRISHSV